MKYPVDLKNFKKVSHDEKSTTLQHPKGHKIMIAHGALDKKTKEKLHALPTHYAEGGDVQKQEVDKEAFNKMFNPGFASSESQAIANYDPNGPPLIPASTLFHKAAPEQTPPVEAPLVNPEQPMSALPQDGLAPKPQDPYGYGQLLSTSEKGIEEQRSGIQAEQQAQQQLGQRQTGIEQQAQVNLQSKLKTFEDHYGELMGERQAFMKDMTDKHIDPQHYLSSMGTGQKVATAIGLILGGMGGGLTHQENPALKFLNDQIDRDIEGQKAELGKTNNLLAANMQQFGNLRDATTMTKIMQNDIVASQLREAAAKAVDPLAKANALKAIGELDLKNAPLIQQMAMRKTLLSGMSRGSVDPSMVVRMMVPEGQQQHAYKELAEAQMITKARDNFLSIFDKVNQINTVGNRALNPLQSSRQIDALVEPAVASLSKSTAGRYTESDAEAIRPLLKTYPGDNAETVKIRRQELAKKLSEQMNFPILQSYGIDAGQSARYNTDNTKKIVPGPPVPPKGK